MSRHSISTGLIGFDQGFAGSCVYLLRHAVITSMWAHPKHPCFVRSQEVHTAPSELCEIERGRFNRLPLLTFCIWSPQGEAPTGGVSRIMDYGLRGEHGRWRRVRAPNHNGRAGRRRKYLHRMQPGTALSACLPGKVLHQYGYPTLLMSG